MIQDYQAYLKEKRKKFIRKNSKEIICREIYVRKNLTSMNFHSF